MGTRKSSYADKLLSEEYEIMVRDKLSVVQLYILRQHHRMHPKELSGPEKVLRKAMECAQKKIDNSLLPEVLEDMAQKEFAKLTLEEKIEATAQLIKEKKAELKALDETYKTYKANDKLIKKLVK